MSLSVRDARCGTVGAAAGAGLALVVPPLLSGSVQALLVLAASLVAAAVAAVLGARSRRERTRARSAARTDGLTGLANRTALEEAAAALLPEGDAALLLLDLDRFKAVNDTLGHAAGDELLVQVAQALRGAVRGDDLVVRLGGDEFAVLLPGVRDATVPLRVARSLWDAVRRPYRVAGTPVSVGVSIGIAVSAEHGTSLGALSAAADTAMYRSKRTQVGPLVADPVRSTTARGGAMPSQAATRLAAALGRGEVGVALQPRLAGAGRLVAVEAVPAWADPQTGPVAPEVLLAAAEDLGLGTALLDDLLDAGLGAAVAPDGRPLRLTVALPSGVLTADGTVALVAARLATAGRDAELLELRVDAADVEADLEACVDRLAALRTLGVRTVLGDAGHGVPAPRLLSALPLDGAAVDAAELDDPSLLPALVQLVAAAGLTPLVCGLDDAALAVLAGGPPVDLELSGPAVCHPLDLELFAVWAADRRTGTRRRRRPPVAEEPVAPAPAQRRRAAGPATATTRRRQQEEPPVTRS